MSDHPLLTVLRDHAAGAPPPPALESHLRECPACTAVLDAERRLLAEIDAVIGQAGAAEPSPGFLVHARSVADLPLGKRRAVPAVWGIAASLLLGMSILVLQRLTTTPDAAPVPATGHTTTASVPEEPLVTPFVASRASRLPVRSAPSAARALPLVPPGEERALVRFATLMANEGLAVPAHLLDPAASSTPIPEPPDLDRPPLSIEPIEANEALPEE